MMPSLFSSHDFMSKEQLCVLAKWPNGFGSTALTVIANAVAAASA